MKLLLMVAACLIVYTAADGDSSEETPIQCLPPKCPFDCEIETEYDGECPGCKCANVDDLEDTAELASPCPPLECPRGCEIEEQFDGPCPGCKCGQEDTLDSVTLASPCPSPECPPDCEIEKEFDGLCPKCKCEKEEAPDLDTKEKCNPVECKPGCRQKMGVSGCPVCLCGMRPKCDPGCKLQRFPGDICPQCYCRESPSVTIPLDEEKTACCKPIVGGCSRRGCTLKIDQKGCVTCECKKCSKRIRCPASCRIAWNGECPTCLCQLRNTFGSRIIII